MTTQICETCKCKHIGCHRPLSNICATYIPMDEVTPKTWDEFRNNGLLWWINMILHTFGWAIVTEIEDGKVINAYPARVIYRGFEERNNKEGYIKVSQFLKENVDDLLDEAKN